MCNLIKNIILIFINSFKHLFMVKKINTKEINAICFNEENDVFKNK